MINPLNIFKYTVCSLCFQIAIDYKRESFEFLIECVVFKGKVSSTSQYMAHTMSLMLRPKVSFKELTGRVLLNLRPKPKFVFPVSLLTNSQLIKVSKNKKNSVGKRKTVQFSWPISQ